MNALEIKFKILCKLSLLLCLAVFFNKTAHSQTFVEQEVIRYIDSFRAEHGLVALKWDTCSYNACKHHSDYIVKYKDYSHNEDINVTHLNKGRFRTTEGRLKYYCGYTRGLGENIASKTVYSEAHMVSTELAKDIVSGWIRSKGHRANLLYEAYRPKAAVAISFMDCDFTRKSPGPVWGNAYATFLVRK